ncbi:MAG: type II toxin-antitoxin system VapC family toxin [Burkholderiales bacterium]
MTVLLDTHAAIWLATDDASFGKRSRALATQALASDQLAVASISFWEIAMLLAKGRLQAVMPPADLRARLLDTGINELVLTGEIALLAASLEALPGDPADRFIAATAIVHQATLVTADERLLGWKHALKRQDATK